VECSGARFSGADVIFSGCYPASLDEKGRIAVPAVFRSLLARMEQGPLHVTPMSLDEKPHLEIFPSESFMKLADQIMAMDDEEDAELLKQEIIGRSQMVELDAQGRIVVPAFVRDLVGLKPSSRVMVEGQITRFDIWEESAYHARRAEKERLRSALKKLKR